MKFDYTYIVLGDFLLFEPLIIVSNFFFLVIALWAFLKLRKFRNGYSQSMRLFMLFIGISGIFGATCHSVHYQWGVRTFNNLLFGVNAFSLLAAFFCFVGTFLHAHLGKPLPARALRIASVWLVAVMVYSFFAGYFVIITIHAGIVLVYSLFVHARSWKLRAEKGSALMVWGIICSFISIIVHALHIYLHDWFNHKDLAHVFMIAAMLLMGKGTLLNSRLHVRETFSPVR